MWKKKGRHQEYWIDGIVVKVNEKKYEDALGYTAKPRDSPLPSSFPLSR